MPGMSFRKRGIITDTIELTLVVTVTAARPKPETPVFG
jgi:hypothetical protein